MHNTCEDSLLAVPLIIDLAILCEVCERIRVRKVSPGTAEGEGEEKFERFHCVNSLLSYLLKAPLVPPGTPVVNALAAQRQVAMPYASLPRCSYLFLTGVLLLWRRYSASSTCSAPASACPRTTTCCWSTACRPSSRR